MNSLHKNLAEVTLCDLRLRVFHFDFFKQKNYVTRALLMFRNWSAWNSSTSPLAPWRENLISGSVRAGFGCQTAASTSTEQSFIYTRFNLKCSKFENKGLQKCTPYWRDCKKKKITMKYNSKLTVWLREGKCTDWAGFQYRSIFWICSTSSSCAFSLCGLFIHRPCLSSAKSNIGITNFVKLEHEWATSKAPKKGTSTSRSSSWQ